jgi:hypothetical protein
MAKKISESSTPKRGKLAEANQKRLYKQERSQFRTLITANPNYFGNLMVSSFKAVSEIQSNTTYEEIGCLGYNPKNDRLEAVVYLNQPSGYGGDVCSDGTPEYVRFFLSVDNGATWHDQGLTSFTAHNILEGTEGAKRLEYAASVEADAAKKFCFQNNQALIRAILSWNFAPPADPDFVPVWGEVQEAYIQLKPRQFFPLGDLLKTLDIAILPELKTVLDLNQPVAASAPKVIPAVKLQELYKDKGVEPHRFALAEIQQFINQPAVSETLMVDGIQSILPGIELDIGELVANLFPTDGNTRYEELTCIGFNPNADTMIGVIRIKKPSGFSGGPCTAGSREYVTFWADFNDNGTFETCLGTAWVQVNDISNIPSEGLHYVVALPIDLKHHRQPCQDGPKVVRIRAILSWQVAPPCGNPNYVPTWGNREETLIHIGPGPNIPFGQVEPQISILGGVPTSKINNFTGLTTADAIIATNNLAVDPLGRPCPFASRVNVKGPQYLGYKYRVQVRRVGDPLWTTVTTPLNVVDLDGNVSTHNHDGSGKFEFLPFTQNIENLLALWDSSGDELWEVRLQIFNMADVLLPGEDRHRVQLDNTRPEAEIHIDTGTGSCGKFKIGDPLSGHFVARDDFFRSYSLHIKPNVNPPGFGILVPTSGNTQTAVTPGDGWTLDTTGMVECGYIIEVVARDRAIVNSVGPGHNHYRTASAGFCLEEPEA